MRNKAHWDFFVCVFQHASRLLKNRPAHLINHLRGSQRKLPLFVPPPFFRGKSSKRANGRCKSVYLGESMVLHRFYQQTKN